VYRIFVHQESAVGEITGSLFVHIIGYNQESAVIVMFGFCDFARSQDLCHRCPLPLKDSLTGIEGMEGTFASHACTGTGTFNKDEC